MKRHNGLLLAAVAMIALILATSIIAVNVLSDNKRIEKNEE